MKMMKLDEMTNEEKYDLLSKMHPVFAASWQVVTSEVAEGTSAGFQVQYIDPNGHILEASRWFQTEGEALNWALQELPEWWFND